MKQIKTITKQLDGSVQFDAEVNAALAEGWTLVKREVLQAYEGQTRVFYRMLYAELEREKKCFNCKNIGTEACRECNDTLDKWEQGHGVSFVPVHPAKDRGARR